MLAASGGITFQGAGGVLDQLVVLNNSSNQMTIQGSVTVQGMTAGTPLVESATPAIEGAEIQDDFELFETEELVASLLTGNVSDDVERNRRQVVWKVQSPRIQPVPLSSAARSLLQSP